MGKVNNGLILAVSFVRSVTVHDGADDLNAKGGMSTIATQRETATSSLGRDFFVVTIECRDD